MFNIFGSAAENRPDDVKGVREALLRFIKEELQRVEGGEGKNIKAIQLFIACDPAEKHIYETAVFVGEEQHFKDEVQKIADDFAIDLPGTWILETIFNAELPVEARKMKGLDVALFIRTKDNNLNKVVTAYVRVLNGEAEKSEYAILSTGDRINIGREKRAQGSDGFFRLNHIAFPDNSKNPCNKYISRQHAHIEWSKEAGSFMLFGDEGGIPPRNKIKIRSVDDAEPVKLNFTQVGHILKEGDQVILGESAVLEFSYKPEE